MRADLNETLITSLAMANSSQLRIIWLTFLQDVLEKISSRHFQEIYSVAFLDMFHKETVTQLI